MSEFTPGVSLVQRLRNMDEHCNHAWCGEAADEIERLTAELAKAERLRFEFADIISHQCISMQAALIEQATGKGDDAALEWIANTLDGPGLRPDFSVAAHLPKTPIDGPAQAWFDSKMAEHEEFRLRRAERLNLRPNVPMS